MTTTAITPALVSRPAPVPIARALIDTATVFQQWRMDLGQRLGIISLAAVRYVIVKRLVAEFVIRHRTTEYGPRYNAFAYASAHSLREPWFGTRVSPESESMVVAVMQSYYSKGVRGA